MVAYDIKPEIEVFDPSHILKSKEMADRGQSVGVPYVQFVMGVQNAMPADRNVFEYCVRLDRDRLAPSNAELVRRTFQIAEQADRTIANVAEARSILGLRAAQRNAFASASAVN